MLAVKTGPPQAGAFLRAGQPTLRAIRHEETTRANDPNQVSRGRQNLAEWWRSAYDRRES
jgi:hypothetical protein